MLEAPLQPRLPQADVLERALDARDPRFDGLFYVGITTTRVYCRPVCPARVSYSSHRRFFITAAAAECAGFRPCLRCRPELAPGRAPLHAVPRLAFAAAHRIGAGALNGHSVSALARELGVSERHLRRALEREIGVSPVELAQTHRLLLAKRLLVDTSLSVTRVAYASGFQSLRRFNTAFRERYRLSPSDLRKTRREPRETRAMLESPDRDLVRLTLSYRAPFAWRDLLAFLSRDAIPGIESIAGNRYARTVQLGEQRGVVFVEDGASSSPRRDRLALTHLQVDVTPSLVPTLMPLLARLRQLFDLDAEPMAIDGHLATSGLALLVEQRPGLRIPGAFDGFEIVLRTLLGRRASRVVAILGEAIDTGVDGLTHLAPSAERIVQAGAARITALGVNARTATQLTAVATLCVAKTLRLEPGGDVTQMHRALLDMGLGDRAATTIVMRALYWPDAFPASDPALQRAAGARSASALFERAERWRPWRAYAAMYLRLYERDDAGGPVTRSSRGGMRRRRSLREQVHY